MDLACLRDDTAHQLGFDRNAASCLRQRATGRRRALFSATRRRRSPREVPLHSSDCSGRLFRIPWLLASAALRQRGRWRRPWQGAGPCRTWRGASALVACGARAASPRGPRLDVLWSSLPKRERVLLRRYRRKVRSDRGDCQIGPLRRRSCMTEVKHYKVETNGIRMHVAEKGRGPLVVLCHGFPESWYSWRHQLRALADAGFRAVAPDMRGYGQTEAPAEIERYTLLDLVGDLVGLLDALGAESAVIAGHDWGAPVAWHSALLRPDRFRAVIGLSVPFRPRGSVRPTTLMPHTDDAVFYQLYFQEPGVAEAELEREVGATIRRLLYS